MGRARWSRARLLLLGSGLGFFVRGRVALFLLFAHDLAEVLRQLDAADIAHHVQHRRERAGETGEKPCRGALAVGLAPVFGYIAAAIGTTLAGWAMLVLLWIGRRDMGEVAQLDDRFKARLPRMVAASGIMGIAIWITQIAIQPLMSDGALKLVGEVFIVVVGIVAYGFAGIMLGAFQRAELAAALRRQR